MKILYITIITMWLVTISQIAINIFQTRQISELNQSVNCLNVGRVYIQGEKFC